MKWLLASLFAALVIFLPLSAEANSIELMVNMGTNPNYFEAHHFKVGIDSWGYIPNTDIYSYEINAMYGWIAPPGQSSPEVGSGTLIDWSGILIYFWSSVEGSFTCGPGTQSWFGGFGCVLQLPGMTLIQQGESIVSMENDFYPPNNEWEFWVSDQQVGYTLVATLPTTVDWFNNMYIMQALVYATENNPKYVMDATFMHPMGWQPGSGINWVDFGEGTIQMGNSSSNDNGFCPSIYSIQPTFDPHNWFSGTTQVGFPGLCSGTLWYQP